MMDARNKSNHNKHIVYINDNINELKICHRREILQIILGSEIELKKIVEKGNGTQIKFGDLSPEIIKTIYNYIYNKLETP
jgi:hypothetical protein